MAFRIEFSADADRELSRLDLPNSRRILKFPHERIAKLDNPRSFGKALQGQRFGEFWRYRVGDFRVICKIEDTRLVV